MLIGCNHSALLCRGVKSTGTSRCKTLSRRGQESTKTKRTGNGSEAGGGGEGAFARSLTMGDRDDRVGSIAEGRRVLQDRFERVQPVRERVEGRGMGEGV